jgi:phage pi2 protein 07
VEDGDYFWFLQKKIIVFFCFRNLLMSTWTRWCNFIFSRRYRREHNIIFVAKKTTDGEMFFFILPPNKAIVFFPAERGRQWSKYIFLKVPYKKTAVFPPIKDDSSIDDTFLKEPYFSKNRVKKTVIFYKHKRVERWCENLEGLFM